MFSLLLILHVFLSGSGECLALDPSTNDYKFLPCVTELGYICQVQQTPHPDKVEALRWPYYVHPLDKMSETSEESFVGFSNVPVHETNLGSSADFLGETSSYITDIIQPLGFSLTSGITIGFWINPNDLIAQGQCVVSLDKLIDIKIPDGVPLISFCNEEGDACIEVKGKGKLEKNIWQFVAITFDSATKEVKIFVNETFGTDEKGESTVSFITPPSINKVFYESFPKLVIGNDFRRADPLLAKVSCLQLFDRPLSNAQIYQMSKICHLPPEYERYKACPPSSVLLSDICFTLSSKPMTYVEAQLECTSIEESKSISKLAYPLKYSVQQELLGLAKIKLGVTSIFLGLDSNSGKFFFYLCQ